jgi:hypothetical protein
MVECDNILRDSASFIGNVSTDLEAFMPVTGSRWALCNLGMDEFKPSEVKRKVLETIDAVFGDWSSFRFRAFSSPTDDRDRLDALGIHNIRDIMQYIVNLNGFITSESAASISEIKIRIEDIYYSLVDVLDWGVVAFEPREAEKVVRALKWIAVGDPLEVTKIAEFWSSRYGIERRRTPVMVYFADKPPGERYSDHITREDLRRYYPQYFS